MFHHCHCRIMSLILLAEVCFRMRAILVHLLIVTTLQLLGHSTSLERCDPRPDCPVSRYVLRSIMMTRFTTITHAVFMTLRAYAISGRSIFFSAMVLCLGFTPVVTSIVSFSSFPPTQQVLNHPTVLRDYDIREFCGRSGHQSCLMQ